MGIFIFYPFAVFLTVYNSAMRAAGDTKTSIIVDIYTNSWNVFWNYALIFGNFRFPELDVMGAGISTGNGTNRNLTQNVCRDIHESNLDVLRI